MVSRRKILSRSRDDLNLDAFVQQEEDVWYQKDKLFRVSFNYCAEDLSCNNSIIHQKKEDFKRKLASEEIYTNKI
jgi:hypothetical protein